MKQVYELNSRVEYYVYRDGKKKFHRVGFVKAYRKGAVQDSLYRLHGRQDTRGGRNQAEADFRLRAKERI